MGNPCTSCSVENAYDYARAAVTGGYDIPMNPARVLGDGDNSKNLSIEIEVALPGKVFYLCGCGTKMCAVLSAALSGGDETTLDTTVTDHKENN